MLLFVKLNLPESQADGHNRMMQSILGIHFSYYKDVFTASQSLVKALWPTNEQLVILTQQFPSSVSLSKLFHR